MEIPLYLAMTATEFHSTVEHPAHIAWMACHFSPYGTGLSNVPKTLPPGSMLILNDRTPICGHDPDFIAKTLCDTAEALECDGILLDFQRAGYGELLNVVQVVLEQANCPVGVSELYAAGFNCSVLVSPIPPHVLPEEALTPWQGRELWLELSTEGTEIAVTDEGSRYTPMHGFVPYEQSHQEAALHCHYKITVSDEQILFQLGRSEEDQSSLLEVAKALGVTRTLGLWQEMHRSFV